MALTETQQHDVIFYLGWPGKTLVTSSTHYNKVIADRLTNLNTNTETQVTGLLAEIVALRTKYGASTSRMLVKKVGDIELNTDEHHTLGREYRRVLRDLSQLLDIPLKKGGGMTIGLCV